MNADKILKRDAELRDDAQYEGHNIEDAEDRDAAVFYLANIATAERALIEAAFDHMHDCPNCDISKACRALLAAMEAAQQ